MLAESEVEFTVDGGYVHVLRRGAPGAPAYLLWIESTRKGAGRELMEKVHIWADERALDLDCVCYKDVVGFYERLGWVRDGTWTPPVADVEHDGPMVIMRRGAR